MADAADRAQVEQDRDLALALDRHNSQQASAHQRVLDGAVVCLDCEEPIPEKRLAVLPNAARCTDCQEVHAKRR